MQRARCGWFAATLVLAAAVPLPAEAQTDVRAIIDKAIQATGGEAKLAKFQAQTWEEKGTYYGMGNGLPYTGKYAMQFPDKFRMEIEGAFLIVLNGDQGWVQAQGDTQEMSKEQLAEQKESMYAGRLTTLVPLKDKAFQLSTLEEIQVEGRPAVGVKVTHPGHRDVKLYFDKQSGLLVRSEQRVRAEELGGKEVTQVATYSDYRAVDGIQVPHKIDIKRDGMKFVEAENSNVKVTEKLPEALFAKP